jgi:hypothetical protein
MKNQNTESEKVTCTICDAPDVDFAGVLINNSRGDVKSFAFCFNCALTVNIFELDEELYLQANGSNTSLSPFDGDEE